MAGVGGEAGGVGGGRRVTRIGKPLGRSLFDRQGHQGRHEGLGLRFARDAVLSTDPELGVLGGELSFGMPPRRARPFYKRLDAFSSSQLSSNLTWRSRPRARKLAQGSISAPPH